MRQERQSDPIKNYRGRGDNGLMTFEEISKRMGLADAASAHNIYNRAMWKLRTRYASRKHEITDLYCCDPEYISPIKSPEAPQISELDPCQFILQPRNYYRYRGK